MKKQNKIFVAGHRGLVGSAIVRALQQAGFENILQQTRQETDLTEQAAVATFFAEQKPDYVILAAAKVGGIWANDHYPADFIQENLQIQTNVIKESYRNGVKRLLFLGSSCIYPRDCPQPIKEDYLLTGPLEPTNRAYALAKIAGIEMCGAYNRQYGTQFLAVMPTNLYGPGDNYDLQTSHVIPALIRKMHEAKIKEQATVTVWGTGLPRREFLYSDDLAHACLFLMNSENDVFMSLIQPDRPFPMVNIGCGSDLTIEALAHLVKEIIGFNGTIRFDATFPDGTPRKMLCVERINQLGWQAKKSLEEGVGLAYQHFKEVCL